MKRPVLACVLLAVAGAALADDARLKPGLWEMKLVRQVVDGQDVTAKMLAAQERARQMMASMSPEQRKQMEAMMGTMPTPAANGTVRICVSPAMAASDSGLTDPQGQCPPAKVERSGKTVTFDFSCSKDGRSMSGHGQTTINGDSVATSVQSTLSDARSGQHTMQSESQMTFVGSDCQGIKPADELMKGAAPAR
jgi:hypothetical protein